MTALQDNVLVIDASVGYRLFVPHTDQMLLQSMLDTRLAGGCRLTAPTLWRYEVTSTLTKGFRQHQLTQTEIAQALAFSLSFSIDLILPDSQLVRAAYEWTLKLQRTAAYDSFYLALAQRLHSELWTYDRRLANAVNEPWVRYLGQTE